MSSYVTVASKLPSPLILRAFVQKEEEEMLQGGMSRKVLRSYETGDRVTVYGNSVAMNKSSYPIEHGYALTHNVPQELWDAWLSVNKDTPLVKNRVIFAMAKLPDVMLEIKKNENVHSGFEQLNPDGDHRTPRQVTKEASRLR